jgi:hypothetical protein
MTGLLNTLGEVNHLLCWESKGRVMIQNNTLKVIKPYSIIREKNKRV